MDINLHSHHSQCGQIRNWLQDGNAIDSITALHLFGCFRLAAVIHVLRHKDCLDIIGRWKISPRGKRYKEYLLNHEQ